MQAVLLKCPPAARFHFGKTGPDENASLYQTTFIPHSDTLFSGMLITCNKLFGSEETDVLRLAIEDGKLVFSSAFYFLENVAQSELRIFFLPKPDYLEHLNKDTRRRKAIRKIAFVSKGIWEQGVVPADWQDRYDEDGKLVFKSECVILQDRFIVLRSELETLLRINPKSEQTTFTNFKKIKIASIQTAPKIADHARRKENNIFFQTDLHLAVNELNEQIILPHFYFLMVCKDPKLEKLIRTIINVLTDEGIGGAISTGCGQLDCKGEAVWEDFKLSYTNGESDLQQVTLSLTSPANEKELAALSYYKVITRGGRPLIYDARLKRIKMIQEGAMLSNLVRGRIPQLEAIRKGKKVTTPVPYYRNGKTFSISIPKNYEINESTKA